MENSVRAPIIDGIMIYYLDFPSDENLAMVESSIVACCVEHALDKVPGLKTLSAISKIYSIEFLSIELRTTYKGFPSNFIEAVFNVYNDSNGKLVNDEPLTYPVYIHHDTLTIQTLERLKSIVEYMGDSYTVDFSREIKWKPETQ